MNKYRIITALLLSLVLLVTSIPAYGANQNATDDIYTFREPLTEEIIKKSLIKTMGLFALFLDDSYYSSRNTIENEMKYLNLSGLGLTKVPDTSDFHSLTVLDLSNNPISDLTPLDNDSRLQGLIIDGTDVSVLPNLPKLTALSAANSSLQDITSLEKNVSILSIIDFHQTPKVDLTPISNATKLTEIYAGTVGSDLDPIVYQLLNQNPSLATIKIFAKKLDDLSFLKNTTSLVELLISSEGIQLTDQNLADICRSSETLSSLHLDDCGLNSIEFVRNLRRLKSLSINNNSISDLSPLSDCWFLSELNANNNKISDLSPIGVEGLSIQQLRLNGNRITDISPLQKLTNLLVLQLAENNISDLTPLSKLTNLQMLSLNNNPLESIKALSKLKNLTLLRLSDCGISDASTISKLGNLTELVLSDNQIESIKPLAKLKNLLTLDISGNPFTSVTALSKSKTLQTCDCYDVLLEDDPTRLAEMPFLRLGNREEYERLDQPLRFDDATFQKAFEDSLPSAGAAVQTETTYRNARDCRLLDLSDLDLQELPDLSAFQQLNGLKLTGNPSLDFAPIANLNLSFLTVEPSASADMTPLYQIKDLEYLGYHATQRDWTQEDESWIASNQNLKFLIIKANNAINSECLGKLKTLETLSLSCAGSFDLANLNGKKKLTQLELSNMALPDLSPFKKLTSITNLTLDNCKEITDFTPLQKLTKMKRLLIRNISCADLTPLTKLTKLAALTLNHCDVVDVAPLKKLKALETLNLCDNQITDLSPLYGGLSKLTSLYLKGNSLSEATQQSVLEHFAFADFISE